MTSVQKNQKGIGNVGVLILIVVIVVVGYVGYNMLAGAKTKLEVSELSGPYSAYTINSKDADFKVEFYDESDLVKNGGNQQIVFTGNDSKKVGVWVKEIKEPASCGDDPTFTYTSKYEVLDSCYRSDRILYASTIKKDKKYYFVSITAQKPVNQSDAVKIFSSVELR